MRTLLVLLAIASGSVFAADKSAEDWPYKDTDRVVVRAFYTDVDMLKPLAAERELWMVDDHKRYALLDANRFEAVQLQQAGFTIEIDAKRTTQMLTRPVIANQRAGIPGFACYRTVDETLATGAALAADHPTLASWIDIGDTWQKTEGVGGNDMMVLRLTNSAISEPKPDIFILSAIHAREYTTAELNTRFAEYLVHGYGSDADATWLLDNHEIHLLLHANPDGREKAQTGLSWRKNTNQNYCSPTSNSRGADLNRNFDFEWGCCGGSSGSQCSETYRGTTPASEPETTAIQSYVQSVFADQRGPNLTDAAPADTSGIFIDVHSFSELVLWPWGFTSTTAPNANGLQALGRKLAWFNGYEPEQSIGLYPTDGTTDDWAYGELGIAAYTFELGTTFFQDCSTFENQILPDNLEALVYAAKASRAPYQLSHGPDSVDVSLSASSIAPGDAVTLTATVRDDRFSSVNGAEPQQAIVAAEYFIDTPPWQTGSAPVAMAAADGAYSGTVEAVSAALDTSALATGQHTIFVHGIDAAGSTGVTSAAFLYVLDPATSPRIAGRVTSAEDGAPLEAIVRAGNFQANSDPITGDYELMVIAGTWVLEIEPLSPDFGTQSISGVTAVDQQTIQQNVTLFPFCEVFADDVEGGDNGWLATGSWARTQESANSPTHSWTDSPGGNYSDNSDTRVVSPQLDLSGVSDAMLTYTHDCDTESGYDYCIVEISFDGMFWQEMARYDGANGWVTDSVSLANVTGSSSAQVRFRLESDFSVTEDGWHVDDVVVRAAGAQCVTVADSDGDGVNDNLDNCTAVANPNQIDTNGDGYGNQCDPDLNGDGIVNPIDLGLFRAGFFSTGVTDTDFNTDGVTNPADLGILKIYFFGPPGPSGVAGP